MTTCYKHYRPGLKRKPCVGYVSLTAAGTHLYLWVERDNVEQSFFSQETQWKQRLELKPPNIRSQI